jgi:hypothetical protein
MVYRLLYLLVQWNKKCFVTVRYQNVCVPAMQDAWLLKLHFLPPSDQKEDENNASESSLAALKKDHPCLVHSE